MAFIDVRLPAKLMSGLQIGPEWSTDVLDMENGREKRNGRWAYPRWRAIANTATFTAADCADWRAVAVAVRGKLNAFRVRDPLDWMASGEALSPSVGTTTAVQLAKLYLFPGTVTGASVPVRAPVSGTVTVYKDGTPVAGTLDATTGLFTPDAAWASGTYTWSGQFDRWMRFDSDWAAVTAIRPDLLNVDIELVEVRR